MDGNCHSNALRECVTQNHLKTLRKREKSLISLLITSIQDIIQKIYGNMKYSPAVPPIRGLPVDCAKCPFTSTQLPPRRDQSGFARPARKGDPRSEIAATIQCLMSAYARF